MPDRAERVLMGEVKSARDVAAFELRLLAAESTRVAREMEGGGPPTGAARLLGAARDAAIAVERIRSAQAKLEGARLMLADLALGDEPTVEPTDGVPIGVHDRVKIVASWSMGSRSFSDMVGRTATVLELREHEGEPWAYIEVNRDDAAPCRSMGSAPLRCLRRIEP